MAMYLKMMVRISEGRSRRLVFGDDICFYDRRGSCCFV